MFILRDLLDDVPHQITNSYLLPNPVARVYLSLHLLLVYLLIVMLFPQLISFPLELFHSSDLEPHASPGLPECERRNPKLNRNLKTLNPAGHVAGPPPSEEAEMSRRRAEEALPKPEE